MSDDLQRWREVPIFRELFLQWRAARATAESRTRPFSRDWERLLQDAELTSADLRREADRDARTLKEAGLVEVKTDRLRPYQIERVSVPLAAEPRLRIIFANEIPEGDEPQVDLSAFPWVSQLDFLRHARTGVPFSDLQLLNEFLRRSPTHSASVPIKERSFEIFGDEKRLDALLLTTLFRPDRLTLGELRGHLVPEPLAWKRGKRTDGPIMVLENAATWDSYCRWDAERRLFSALVYGCGNRFRDGVSFLQEIFAELGGGRPILYFGDLDPQGIRIPIQASMVARRLSLLQIVPDLWSYQHLLRMGKPQPHESSELLGAEEFAWFGDLGGAVEALQQSGCRLAQEAVGWEFLRGCGVGDPR